MRSSEEYLKKLWFAADSGEIDAVMALARAREEEVFEHYRAELATLVEGLKKIKGTLVSSRMSDYMDLPIEALRILKDYEDLKSMREITMGHLKPHK